MRAFAGQPPPHLNVTSPDVPTDEAGDILLPLPQSIDHDALERSVTVSTDPAYAETIWRKIIPELVEGWMTLPSTQPLSWGRLFLADRERLVYWPKLINLLLPHIPISYDHAADLVRQLTLLGFKIDLKAAFRSLRIAKRHAPYYGAVLDSIFIQMERAPFGSTCSPAQFVLLLRMTVVRVRGQTPAFDEVIAGFVDDLAGAAGANGPRDPSAAASKLMGLADRLVSALIADGWWISIPKTFLRPAIRLYYTGIIVHLSEGELGIAPEKAAKLRRLLAALTLPNPLAFATTTTDAQPTIVPQLRTACAAEPDLPIAVAALPIQPLEWPAAPLYTIRLVGLSDEQAGHVPDGRAAPLASLTIDTLQTHLSALPAPSDRSRSPGFILIAVPSHAVALAVAGETPSTTVRRLHAPVVVAYPRTDEPVDTTYTWFSASMRLPWPTPRTLPQPDAKPPPLPPTDPPTPAHLPNRNDLTTHLTDTEYAALDTILGLIAWLSCIVPSLARWLPALRQVHRTAEWNPQACTAVAFIWQVAPYLPQWKRQLRRTPSRTLHIAVDTARGSWASIRPPARMTVGTIPFHARAASTLAREAWGVVGAVQAEIRRNEPFDAVSVDNDNEGLTLSAGAATVPTPDAAPPMRILAALDAQGVPVAWNWRSRATPHMQITDAGTTAAVLRINPLRRHIASYLYASLPNGWQADAPSDDDRAWSATYLTAGAPESQRKALFDAAAVCAARESSGWLGDMGAWRHVHNGRTLFAHGLWSQLHYIADLATSGAPMLVIAPLEGAGQWWAPALELIRQRATTVRTLPAAATDHPNAPAPRDPNYATATIPPPPVADVRRLAAYYVNTTCNPVPFVADRPGRPLWWTPWRLTADGDVEEVPGPYKAPTAQTRHARTVTHDDTTGFARPIGAMHDVDAMHRDTTTATTTQATHAAAHHVEGRSGPAGTSRKRRQRSASLQHNPGPTTLLRADDTTGFARPTTQPAVYTAAPTIHQPTSADQRPPLPRTTTAHTPAQIVQRHAAAGLIPTAAATATINSWLLSLRDFLTGTHAGAVDATVPDDLKGFVATARATARLKTVMGGGRAEKTTRYLLQLTRALGPGVADAPMTLPAIDALACAYAIRRLERHPPFGWFRCDSADTPSSDLSSVAELSRKMGVHMSPQLGPLAASYLAARGAGATPDHSNAWPIHLADLIAVEPTPRNPTNPKWVAWAACTICSAFCLRPGVIPHLTLRMFVAWDGGYILIWRWRFKASGGDVLDPELRSPTVRVAGARFPTLTTIFHTLQQHHQTNTPIFPASINKSMAAFVQATFPAAPKGFTFRVYGIRIAADVTACALDIPEDITNAMFWWRTVQRAMRAYYGALMVRRMYAFAEARTRLRCIHITPGRFDARLTSGTVPDLSAAAMLDKNAPPMPPLLAHDLEAAWGAETTIARDRHDHAIRRIDLGRAAWATLPADAPPSDDDDTRSLDCEGCSKHLGARDAGTLCDEERCKAVRCPKCQVYRQGWRCANHSRDTAGPKRVRTRK
jgi:hypothetical protein